MRIPSGNGSFLPLSSCAFKSYTDEQNLSKLVEFSSTIKRSKSNQIVTYSVIGFVPVADEDGVIAGGIWEGDGDPRAAENTDATESSGGFVESE